MGERGETPDLPGDGDGAQSDTLEVVEEFENQALKEEEVLAEDVVPSEIDGVPSDADAFEMAAARADKIREAKEPEAETFSDQDIDRQQAELEAEFNKAVEFEKAEAERLRANKQLEEVEQEAQGKELLPGYIYPTDPVTLERVGKPYPESDTRYSPVQRPRSTPAELEPSAISTAPEPLPALPTMEVLLELGVSQRHRSVSDS